ncbi:hypothetical protein OTU49_011078, partial [Cherax quadricarinatus]
MTAVFDQLLQEEVFVDVTLSCEGGQQLRAHKVVLAACSPYFQAVLQNNPCKHPIVILPRDVAFADLRAIIEFVYRGEIDVAQEQINSLLAAADTLKIKGLCEVGDDPTHVPPGFTATPSTASSRHSSTSHTPTRGRPPYTRGRYNTSYRPRGRPPLYGKHRYERPSLSTPASRRTDHDHHSTNKRIKLETEDDSHGAGSEGEVGQQRPPHPHYVHNGGAAPTPSASHPPPAAHAHHAPPTQAVHPSQAHPPAAHAPPPLPELGPSVGLPQPETALPPHVLPGLSPSDDGAGTSHAADYNTGYGPYTKNEGDPHHLTSDGTDSSGQRMTVTPELLGLMPSNATSHYSS